MASSKLLKEAIADAKAVRETALANAKIQLEEAFTPRLKSMLSQKLRAEAEDMESDEDEMKEAYGEDDEKEEEKVEEEYSSSNIGAGNGGTTSGQNNKKPSYHDAGAEDKLGAAGVTSTSKKPEAEVEEYEFTKSITEADGEEEDLASGDVKFATEGDEFDQENSGDEQSAMNNEMDGNEDEMQGDDQSEDDLDLESIIRELEQELHYGDNEMEEESDEDNIDSDEFDQMGEEADDVDTAMDAENPHAVYAKEGEENDEEEMNIEEIIKELEDEEKAEEEEKEKVEETKVLKAELAEAISVIKSLKSTINEVNLLNAKLLFSNKLFRSYNLTNEQKSKVIDSLDRTTNVREVKLVYSTLAESMKFSNASTKKAVKQIAEGASRVQKSTKPTAQSVISEGTSYANRFKELAGILK
jgi:hypothetical protein